MNAVISRAVGTIGLLSISAVAMAGEPKPAPPQEPIGLHRHAQIIIQRPGAALPRDPALRKLPAEHHLAAGAEPRADSTCSGRRPERLALQSTSPSRDGMATATLAPSGPCRSGRWGSAGGQVPAGFADPAMTGDAGLAEGLLQADYLSRWRDVGQGVEKY